MPLLKPMEPGIPGCCCALALVMQNAKCKMQTPSTTRRIRAAADIV